MCGDGYLLGDDAVIPEDYHDVDLEVDREQVGPDRRTAKVPEKLEFFNFGDSLQCSFASPRKHHSYREIPLSRYVPVGQLNVLHLGRRLLLVILEN